MCTTRARRGEIALSNVRYETSACPPNQYMPNKKNTVCLLFTATAENNLKRNVEAANIFGFVDDQQNNSAVGFDALVFTWRQFSLFFFTTN